MAIKRSAPKRFSFILIFVVLIITVSVIAFFIFGRNTPVWKIYTNKPDQQSFSSTVDSINGTKIALPTNVVLDPKRANEPKVPEDNIFFQMEIPYGWHEKTQSFMDYSGDPKSTFEFSDGQLLYDHDSRLTITETFSENTQAGSSFSAMMTRLQSGSFTSKDDPANPNSVVKTYSTYVLNGDQGMSIIDQYGGEIITGTSREIIIKHDNAIISIDSGDDSVLNHVIQTFKFLH